MSPRRKKKPSRAVEALRFWGLVLLVTAVCAIASFHVAKHVVGEALMRTEAPRPRPRFAQQLPQEAEEEKKQPESDEPPLKPIIKLLQRQPTELEKIRAKQEKDEASKTEEQQPAAEEDSTVAPEPPQEAPVVPVSSPEAQAERPAERKAVYTVRVGSFADRENAQAEVRRLAADGYQPFITTVEIGGETYHRVNVATFRHRNQATALVNQLTREGYDATVTEEEAER